MELQMLGLVLSYTGTVLGSNRTVLCFRIPVLLSETHKKSVLFHTFKSLEGVRGERYGYIPVYIMIMMITTQKSCQLNTRHIKVDAKIFYKSQIAINHLLISLQHCLQWPHDTHGRLTT